MTARLWSAACAAVVLGTTMTVLAQDPQYPSSSSSQKASQSTSAKSITVTGCVQRAQPAPTGTTGAPEMTAPVTKFVLTNASVKPSGTAGTSGTTAPPATAIASEYRLDTQESTLSSHVGHKVEITGTVEPPSRGEQKPTASAANAPTLKVDDVKMIASSCQ